MKVISLSQAEDVWAKISLSLVQFQFKFHFNYICSPLSKTRDMQMATRVHSLLSPNPKKKQKKRLLAVYLKWVSLSLFG